MAETFDIKWNKVEELVDAALAEDLGRGDVTTEALITADRECRAYLVAKGEGILAGMGVAAAVFRRVDPELTLDGLVADGGRVRRGDKLAFIEGKVAGILRAERVALNFLQHLSGIATETARYVDAVSGTGVVVTDTRKTIPGLRLLEKYAVRVGGGKNHRLNLGDGILIKDNHLTALSYRGGGLGEVVGKARERAPEGLKIEVEVESVDKAGEALSAGADVIMLDNMSLDDMRQVVVLVQGRVVLEASGGITLENVRAVAETGVDLISIGALTHSARALDISMEVEPG